jgi:hypothetical protein
MSSELACRALASARRETFRHRDATIDPSLPSCLSKRRGDISHGTAPSQPGAPHICREDTPPAARFLPLYCEGRDNRAVHSATSRRRLVATLSQGLPRFAPNSFPLTAWGAKITASSAKTEMDAFAKSFFAGKFGVSLFRSNE